jgi:hypothetical protein
VSLPIQKSTAKTVPLSIQKSAAKYCVAANSEIGINSGVVFGFNFFFLGVYNKYRREEKVTLPLSKNQPAYCSRPSPSFLKRNPTNPAACASLEHWRR